jgi:hypothetical protein
MQGAAVLLMFRSHQPCPSCRSSNLSSFLTSFNAGSQPTLNREMVLLVSNYLKPIAALSPALSICRKSSLLNVQRHLFSDLSLRYRNPFQSVTFSCYQLLISIRIQSPPPPYSSCRLGNELQSSTSFFH